jgi:hypothetical protein
MKYLSLLTLLCLLSMPASADRMAMLSDAPKSYETECASCHMAYPPGLLGQQNWQNIMSSLDKHFGTDASLDAKTQTEITQWLIKNAAIRQKYSTLAPENRVTQSVWFVREHREINAEVWLRDSIKSRSNCMACHLDAIKGIFNDDNIRIPTK